MKNLMISLLIFLPLQLVSGQDKNAIVQKTPDPAHRWMVGVQLGGSSLLASTANYELSMLYYAVPQQVPNYDKQINQGWSFNGNIHNMFSKYFGLGVKYSYFSFSTQNEFTMRGLTKYEYLYIIMKQKQFIHYAGPSVISQQWLNKNQKLRLTETISAGYLHYRDELRIDTYYNAYYPYHKVLVKRNTWGVNGGIGLDYYPVSRLSIGANFGFTYARFNKVKVTTLSADHKTKSIELEDYQPLSILDYSLSVRFHF